jgi:wyosine [tRNA(Phe)-imidazoG37] synthetase (radical SAM superfamily)
VLAKRAGDEIDWITVVASGEPLLYAGLGPLLREIKALSRWPLAVITNGSLLSHPEIRRELLAADAVLPSLDAGTADLYRRINRPHPGVPFEAHVRGLEVFRTEFSGRLWVEVMLLSGLNDSEEALRALADLLVAIRPDAIHLTTPTRPPAEPWVRPADREGILRAQAILGEAATVVHPAQGSFDLSAEEGQDAVIEAIIAILKRHPVRSDDLRAALAERGDGRADETISRLQSSGRVRLVERLGVAFWTHADSVFPERGSRPIGHAHSGDSGSDSDS